MCFFHVLIDCEPYHLPNGSVWYSNFPVTNPRRIPFSTVASFSCNKGYILHGPYTKTCQESGEWSDGTHVPKCKQTGEAYTTWIFPTEIKLNSIFSNRLIIPGKKVLLTCMILLNGIDDSSWSPMWKQKMPQSVQDICLSHDMNRWEYLGSSEKFTHPQHSGFMFFRFYCCKHQVTSN